MNKQLDDSERTKRFDRVIGIHYKDLYRYAIWLSRDRGVAEEVVQESLLRAWRSLESLRDDSTAKYWLLTIVRRENARYFKKAAPDTINIDELTETRGLQVSTTENPDIEEMRRAIFSLTRKYREPLILQVLLGYSTDEIAKMLGMRRGAVLTRLHRARLQVKQQLQCARSGERKPSPVIHRNYALAR